jgi:hypothetical protein
VPDGAVPRGVPGVAAGIMVVAVAIVAPVDRSLRAAGYVSGASAPLQIPPQIVWPTQ